MHSFPLDQGGRFINNEKSIPDYLVTPVLDIFASIVSYDSENRRYTTFDSPIYDVMPSIFTRFANGSRTSEGYRLLKRCLWHSFYPKTPPLMERNAMLFIHEENNNIGLVLEKNEVGASMKDAQYNVAGSDKQSKSSCCTVNTTTTH